MHYEVEVNGQVRQVTVTRRNGRFVVTTGSSTWTVDAAQVGPHLLSLLIENGDTEGDGRSNAGPGSVATSSREIAIGADGTSGQFVFGIGTLPLPVALNTRKRFGQSRESGHGGSGPQRIVAPMPGKVVRVLAKAGDTVARRQPVVVIEAMKMENELRASQDGTVTELLVREGQSVEAGTLLAVITPA